VFVDRDLFDAAWRLFKRRGDKSWSLTDCVSFSLMHQRNLDTALTFDKHFAQAGFTMLP
jgi:predicted nucleic acid-binding protein